jgi:hypothetical protein
MYQYQLISKRSPGRAETSSHEPPQLRSSDEEKHTNAQGMRTATQPSKRWQEQEKHESARMRIGPHRGGRCTPQSADFRLIGSLFSVHASGRELKLSRPGCRAAGLTLSVCTSFTHGRTHSKQRQRHSMHIYRAPSEERHASHPHPNP